MARPIRVAGAALVAGAVVGRTFAGDALAIVAVAGAVVLLAVALSATTVRRAVAGAVPTSVRAWVPAGGDVRRRWLAAAAAAAFVAGVLRAAPGGPGDLSLPDIDVAAVDGTVTAGPDLLRGDATADDGPRRRASLRLDLGPAEGRVLLDLPADAPPPDLLPGDRVRVVGRVRPRGPPRNPGRPVPSARLPVLDVFAASVVRTDGPAGDLFHVLRRAAERIRRTIRDRLRAACGGETRAYGVFLCILTGDRGALPPEVSRAFRDSGTAHLLAVSGLHVALLVAVLAALGRRVVPAAWARAAALPATAAVVLLYAGVCRFDTPVVRSGVFLIVAACGRAAARRTSTLDHLALAAALVVAWDPDQVADTGFQLSFAAVAGIALLGRRFRGALFPGLTILLRFPEAMSRRRMRLHRGFATGLATSLAAQAATAPVVANAFGTSQPLGALANLVAVPLFAAVLPVALALAAFGGAAPWATGLVADAAAGVFTGVVGVAAAVPLGHAELGRPPPVLLALSVALLVAAARRPTWTRRDLLLPAAAWAAVALGPAALAPAPRTEIDVLDVGHGLSVLVRTREGAALLYDAGGRAPGLGDRAIVPALRALGVRRLTFLCVSHEDADHCNAAADVLREVPVDSVVVPAGFGASPLAGDVLAACRAAAVPVTCALRGDRLAAAGLRGDVLGPASPALSGAENGDSLVLRLECGSGGGDDGGGATVVLLPGDIEGDDVAALAADPLLGRCDVVVLPHHGRGDPATHAALVLASGASAAVASESDPAAVELEGAWISGLTGALRLRPGRTPEAYPWRDDD